MSVFQVFPQGGVPLYQGNLRVGIHVDFTKWQSVEILWAKNLADRLVIDIYIRMYVQIVKLPETKICYIFAKICEVLKNLLT